VVKLEHALEIYWNDKKALNTMRYVTQTYHAFDFLLGVGELFFERADFHKFKLTDVFDILFEYAQREFPNDIILQELIGLDYYLHFKIRPQVRYLSAMTPVETRSVLQAQGIDGQIGRYLAFKLHFDFERFQNEMIIEKIENDLLMRFTGVSASTPIFQKQVTS
jgi:hypothetical protein